MEHINTTAQGKITAHQKDATVPGGLDDLNLAGRVDFIILSEVFEHLSEPRAAMANLVPLLRSGGRMFFTAQCTEGRLPVRPEEPIYATRGGMEKLLSDVATGLTVVEWKEAAGRWKIVLERP